MELFTDRHAAKISGELSCLDRVVISGTIPGICYAEGMSTYLRIKGIRIFDYARWAEPLRDQIRQNAQRLAEEAGLSIEPLSSSKISKESLVEEILKKRGVHEGLVCIFSVKAEHVAVFLGRKLHGQYCDELGVEEVHLQFASADRVDARLQSAAPGIYLYPG